MSTQNKLGKIITRFEIGFDNETKADIDALTAKLAEVTRVLSVKNDSHGDRLLAAMQAEAANDAPVTSSPWKSDLKLATVNDVDYLSGNDLAEYVPYLDINNNSPCWMSVPVPKITQADMQLIFIKNLSETLIQRMHSMDRFSDDDDAIGGKSLESWDIVFCELIDAYAILTRHKNGHHADLLILGATGPVADAGWCTDREAFKTLRTITEAELSAFRAALEACYA